jgi:tetratricopeptide (TPR) repeat protein
MVFLIVSAILLTTSCLKYKIEDQYQVAEHLSEQKQYNAAIKEYERIYYSNPQSEMGAKSLYQSAIIESSFLKKFKSASQKLERLLQESQWINQKKIKFELAELYFIYLENYTKAVLTYQDILKHLDLLGDEKAFVLLRMLKSYFYVMNFSQAFQVIKEMIETNTAEPYLKEAYFYQALIYFTLAEKKFTSHWVEICKNRNDCYQKSINLFNIFLKRYVHDPEWIDKAKFSIAECYEELQKDQTALDQYKELLKSPYTSQEVLKVKIQHISDRLHKKNNYSKN